VISKNYGSPPNAVPCDLGDSRITPKSFLDVTPHEDTPSYRRSVVCTDDATGSAP
jgi:hypothetical protein